MTLGAASIEGTDCLLTGVPRYAALRRMAYHTDGWQSL